MTPEQMVTLIEKVAADVSVQDNVVECSYDEERIVLVYDTNADRMRLISAIIRVSDLSQEQLQCAMEANFHSALDARYAIGNDVLWAAFIHPLSSLTEDLFLSALTQVATANKTFDGEYQSGALVFGH